MGSAKKIIIVQEGTLKLLMLRTPLLQYKVIHFLTIRWVTITYVYFKELAETLFFGKNNSMLLPEVVYFRFSPVHSIYHLYRA